MYWKGFKVRSLTRKGVTDGTNRMGKKVNFHMELIEVGRMAQCDQSGVRKKVSCGGIRKEDVVTILEDKSQRIKTGVVGANGFGFW